MKQCSWELLLIIITFALVREGQTFCRRGSLDYGSLCISIVRDIKDYTESDLQCHFEAGKLLSISSIDLLKFLEIHFNSFQGKEFWVGVNRTNPNYWVDGVETNQPWVNLPQDLNITEPGTTCFVFNGETVQPRDCNSTHGSLCVSQKTLFNPTENCLSNRTEHSFIGEVSGNCIYRSPDATNRSNVDAKCAENGGIFLDLADITREGLTTFKEHNIMTNDGYRYWTALTFNDSKVYWKSGRLLTVSFPLVPGNGSCITISIHFTSSVKVQLFQTECADHAYVICAAPRATTTTALPPPQMQTMKETLLCPQGHNWKTFRATGDCYWETSFETRRLTWDEARAYCQGYGGDLSSFHSVDEEKIGLSFQYGTLAHPYWIGLKWDNATDTFKWSDGTTLDYENWAPGHPDRQDKRMRCVAMDASMKHWKTSICGVLSWFVCKAPKRANPPVPRIPARRMLPSCSEPSFATSTFYFEGYCYEVINLKLGWHRAKEYCQNRDSTLVSIHSDDEIGFLLRMLYDDQNTRGNRVWIGLNSLSGAFRWTDLSPVDMTFWSPDEPNNGLNQEKCVNMFMTSGRWNDENCNSEMGFICKRVENATTPATVTTINPLIGNCKKGWYPYHDRCYLPVGFAEKDRANWTTANNICETLGGCLVAIRDEREQAFISYLMQGLKNDTWIGLHDTIESGRYYWVDNSDMRYTNWAIGEPSVFGIMEDCVKMVYGEVDSGVWKDDECKNKLPYICQAAKDPNLPKPAYNRGTSCIYPEGWLKLDDMCFKMYAGNPLKWPEAESACQRDGAHLISVSGPSVRAVATYLGSEVNQTFWIGLQYEASRREFEWLNGWIMTFSKWGKSAPAITGEDSCYASVADGDWNSFPCNEEMPYICQITTGKGPYRVKYGGECPKGVTAWVPTDGSYCYLFGQKRTDWLSATINCFRQGSYLISLHSMNDIDIVKKTLKESGLIVPSLYIGLMRNQKGGFSWADNTPVEFINWDENEPDNDVDSCVEMMTHNFKWRVVPCSTRRHYICSIQKDRELENIPESAKLEGGLGGLSAATLTAIILCLSLAVIVIIVGAFFFRPSLGRTRFRVPFKQHSMSFENALFSVNSASMEFQDERKDSFDST